MNVHSLQIGLISYFWFLLAITIHGWACAWAAYHLGDDTPSIKEHMTLNPLAHLSLIGTVLIPLSIIFSQSKIPFLMGWGCSPTINVNNFKHPKIGDIIYSLVGSFMNFFFGLLAILLRFAIEKYNTSMCDLFAIGASVNIAFGLFNLIPIPPLHGSRLLKIAMRMGEETYMTLSWIGMFVLLFVINLPVFKYYFSIIHHFILNRFWEIGNLLFN